MKHFPKLIWAMTAAALVLTLAPVAMAGGNCCPDEGEGQLAELDYGRSAVAWRVFAEHESVRLTVSTPCGVFDRVYPAGKNPFFDIAELGEDDPNGQYTWQIRIQPVVDPDVQKALMDARESGDDRIVGELRRKGLLPKGPFIQTGEFQVVEHSIVPPGSFEKTGEKSRVTQVTGAPGNSLGLVSDESVKRITAADTVISGDLTVYNSLCVGFDCLTNETYNADTIRLKENNLRIHVHDTSSATGFPSTDWRLEFNSQNSGGQNYFRVIDATTGRNIMTLEGSAPSNSLVVDNGGRVGMGTANPVVELHVVNGDTPTLRLDQNTSSGFAAQVWDVAGNETSFFVRDTTNGSTLPFRIFPGASSNSLVIDDTNNVGLGTTSPSSKLHLTSGIITVGGHTFGERSTAITDIEARALRNWIMLVDSDNDSTNAGLVVARDGNPNSVIFHVKEDGTSGVNLASSTFPFQVGTDSTNGNGAHVTAGGTWMNGSSRASKKGIADLALEDALATLAALRPVRYAYKGEPGEEYLGFIAEDVPELVAHSDRKTLSPMDIVAVLTRVGQQQQSIIDNQNRAIAEQARQLVLLQEKVDRLAGEAQ